MSQIDIVDMGAGIRGGSVNAATRRGSRRRLDTDGEIIHTDPCMNRRDCSPGS